MAEYKRHQHLRARGRLRSVVNKNLRADMGVMSGTFTPCCQGILSVFNSQNFCPSCNSHQQKGDFLFRLLCCVCTDELRETDDSISSAVCTGRIQVHVLSYKQDMVFHILWQNEFSLPTQNLTCSHDNNQIHML